MSARNGVGTAGLVLGIIAAAIGFIPFLGLFSFVLGPLAVILGAIGWSRTRGQNPTANNPVASLFGVGLGALGVILAIAMAAAMNSVVDEIDRELGADSGSVPAITDNEAASDVAVLSCEIIDQFGTRFAEGTVEITNSTDRTQSYTATISVDDETGARLGEINVITNSLGAGQSTTLSGMEATGNVSQDAAVGAASCSVAGVHRFPS